MANAVLSEFQNYLKGVKMTNGPSSSQNADRRFSECENQNINQPKLLCYYCEAKTGTKLVAFYQIAYATLISVVRLAAYPYDVNINQLNTVLLIYGYFEGEHLLAVQLLESLTDICFGVILLAGIHLARPSFLVLWLIARWIEILCQLFALIGFLLYHWHNLLPVFWTIFILLLFLAVQLYSFLVVYIYFRELVDKQNVDPNIDSIHQNRYFFGFLLLVFVCVMISFVLFFCIGFLKLL